jgi:hypothetical protein
MSLVIHNPQNYINLAKYFAIQFERVQMDTIGFQTKFYARFKKESLVKPIDLEEKLKKEVDKREIYLLKISEENLKLFKKDLAECGILEIRVDNLLLINKNLMSIQNNNAHLATIDPTLKKTKKNIEGYAYIYFSFNENIR